MPRNVLKLEPNMDVYPGLNLGLHNLCSSWFRYFFTDGFGLFEKLEYL
jgi:hypothetical protein